jgi:DNA-binding HxlR family transcriptional regulator
MIKKGTRATISSPVSKETECPVARGLSIVGDRWTVLVLRELTMGNRRFEEIQAQTGATPQMLAARLKKLETDRLVERRPYSTRPLRHDYYLTEAGLAFYPVLLALRSWGETWLKSEKEARAIHYTHIPCGQDPGLGPVCQSCGGEMRQDQLVPRFSKAFARERDARRTAFKAARPRN